MKNGVKLVVGIVAFAGLMPVCAHAQQQPQPLKVTKVKDNVYWIEGEHGNHYP